MLPSVSAMVRDDMDQLTSYVVSCILGDRGSSLLYDDAYPDVSIIELLPS